MPRWYAKIKIFGPSRSFTIVHCHDGKQKIERIFLSYLVIHYNHAAMGQSGTPPDLRGKTSVFANKSGSRKGFPVRIRVAAFL